MPIWRHGIRKDALAPQALYMAAFASLRAGDYKTALAHAEPSARRSPIIRWRPM